MLKRSTSYITILTVLITAIAGQVDPQLCPSGSSSTILHPLWQRVPSRFEIITEVSSAEGLIELSQAFAPRRDAVTFTLRGSKSSRMHSCSYPRLSASLISTSSMLLEFLDQ